MSPKTTTNANPQTVRNTQGILLRAADLIESHGRCTGEFQNRKGQVCAIGALRLGAGATHGRRAFEANGNYPVAYPRAVLALAADLDQCTLDPHTAVMVWSDGPKMSAKRVARRLRKVAANLG